MSHPFTAAVIATHARTDAPRYTVQKTSPEFAAGAPDMRWHVLDADTGRTVRFTYFRREAADVARDLNAEIADARMARLLSAGTES